MQIESSSVCRIIPTQLDWKRNKPLYGGRHNSGPTVETVVAERCCVTHVKSCTESHSRQVVSRIAAGINLCRKTVENNQSRIKKWMNEPTSIDVTWISIDAIGLFLLYVANSAHKHWQRLVLFLFLNWSRLLQSEDLYNDAAGRIAIGSVPQFGGSDYKRPSHEPGSRNSQQSCIHRS